MHPVPGDVAGSYDMLWTSFNMTAERLETLRGRRHRKGLCLLFFQRL